jgi:predicted metalloprotease with PDZ domain
VTKRAIVLCLVLAVLVAANALAVTVDYTVTVDDPPGSVFHIQGVVSDLHADSVDLVIPRWSPGYYQLREYYKGVQAFVAESGDSAIAFEHPDDITWRLYTSDMDNVELTYDVKADQRGLGFMDTALNPKYGFISGAAAFMFVQGHPDAPYTVRFALPSGWQTASGLPEQDGLFHSPDYDTLVDCPFQLGLIERHDYKIDEVPYSFVVARSDQPEGAPGEPPAFDADALFAKITPLIREQIAIFGAKPPYESYMFIFHLGRGSGGGIEHANSTVIGGMYGGPAVDVISHEFFHTWNIKRIRPEVLWPFDYTKECRSRNYWFAEGVTTFYQVLAMRRCGITDDAEYYRSIAGQIAQLKSNPNRATITADDCSWKAWEGTAVGYGGLDYYNKGLLIGLCLDLKIREVTADRRGLDDVMRYLYREYYEKGRGVPEDGIRDAVSEIAGADLSEFYDLCARSTQELPIEECLRYAGLDVSETSRPVAFLGVEFDYMDRGEGIRLGSVIDGQAAAEAGLQAGDRILKVDGEAVRGSGRGSMLGGVLRAEEIGKQHTFTILRGEEQKDVQVTIGSREEKEYHVVELGETSERQRALREAWLGSVQRGA